MAEGLSLKDLGRAAYEAYGEVVHWRNYEGKPMPGWDDLPENIQKAWAAGAARARWVMPGDSGGPWGPPLDGVASTLEPVNSRLQGLLRTAQQEGWSLSRTGCTTVMRLHKPGDPLALPFYVSWDLIESKPGVFSWRFHGAKAQNGQALNWNDIKTYLADSSVIHPEPPTSETE